MQICSEFVWHNIIVKYWKNAMKKNNKHRTDATKPRTKTTSPIRHRHEIQQNPDNKIDQDFPGYPHAPSSEKNIRPATKEEKLVAGTLKKERTTNKNRKINSQPEIESDGSADAFSRTELSEEMREKPKATRTKKDAY